MEEIKQLLEEQGRAFEAFKKANDERLKSIETKGYAPADLTVKVDQINAQLTQLGRDLDEVAKKANRPPAAGTQADEAAVEHKQAFDRWFRKGDEQGLATVERKAMNIGSDPDGGYFVPQEVEATIDRVVSAEVSMRGLARTITIGTNSYKKPVVVSGASGGWLGETEDSTETSTPKVAELEFVPGKVYAEPWATNDLLEDNEVNLEAWLSDEVTTTFGEMEGSAYINGTGVKQPRGLLSYSIVANTSYAWGSIGYTASGNAGAWAASNPSDKLIDLIHTLKPRYRQNGAWLMNDLTLASIRKFKDGQGQYMWQPGLQAGQAGILLGYPVSTDDYMPDIAANSYSVAFADFRRAYLIVQRRGIAVIRDNITKKGYTKFYTTRRVGGGVQNFEAVKVMKFAAS